MRTFYFATIKLEYCCKLKKLGKKEKIEMTNIEKAKALINTFASGDVALAKSLLKEDYIQHDLNYGTGRDAFLASVSYLASAPVKTTVNNIRAYEDDDKVVLQTIYNFAGVGSQVAFDIFRFEDGLIAEHWDNLTNLAKPNLSATHKLMGILILLLMVIQKKLEK